MLMLLLLVLVATSGTAEDSLQAVDDGPGDRHGSVSVAGADINPVEPVGPALTAVELGKGKRGELGRPVPTPGGKVRVPEPVIPTVVEFGQGNGAIGVRGWLDVLVAIPVPEDTGTELEFFQGKGDRTMLELAIVVENAGAVLEAELPVDPAAVGSVVV